MFPKDNYQRGLYDNAWLAVMATPAVRPTPQICAEKKRLAHVFVDSIRTVMGLQAREIAEVAREGVGLQRFALAIERARSRRDEARQAYLLHVQVHGC
jgi:hypothetical protein